jgi:hypothetical protein
MARQWHKSQCRQCLNPGGVTRFACSMLAGSITFLTPFTGMVTLRMRPARAAAALHPRLAIAKLARDFVSVSQLSTLQMASSGSPSIGDVRVSDSYSLELLRRPCADADRCTARDFVKVGKFTRAAATTTFGLA